MKIPSIAVWLLAAVPAGALEPSQVLILINRDTPLSAEVARMYQEARHTPAENVLSLHLGTSRYISREQYRTRLALPLKKRLEEQEAIRCILTTAGVPYVIEASQGRRDGAAVDNELAAVLRDEPANLDGWQPNPLYYRGQNPLGATDPRSFKMVYVSRLDGPDLKTLKRMVEDSIAAESTGLSGPAFGDAQGLDGNTGYAAADASIRGAIDRLSGAGFPAVLDMRQEDWRPPAGGVGEQAAGAAFYVGWYSLQKFQDIFGRQGLARGAIAWHIASGEAVNIWDLNSTEWCINLIRRGAAATIGPVFEPFVGAFPKADILVETVLTGRSLAEGYWLSLPHVSWSMVLLGDPLYRPFGVKPKPALIARAYVGAAGRPAVEKGRPTPILIQVQCVGPAGSGTPPFTAAVEPDAGLAGASGMVTIPALQAGQATVVRAPSVTAANDAGAMFRLRLAVRNPGETRNIVLEGRTGFAKVVGMIERQTQMVASPNGLFVISGNPGALILTETSTLQVKNIAAPQGWAAVGASFSPDDAHVVLALVRPEQKQVEFMLTDSRLQKADWLPGGSQFIRWLSNDTMLVRRSAGLSELQIGRFTLLPVFEPPGWKVMSIIPGTRIQLLTTDDGRFAVREAAGPVHEVLAGVRMGAMRAAADDLTLFGGLDDQKRLWVQHGTEAKPEVIAEGVERVAWGPVSRRLLAQGAGANARLYDGRSRSWIPLPPVLVAQWSPDERRLLFVEAEQRDGALVPLYVTLLRDRETTRLFEIGRVGEIGGVAFTHSGTAAFVLSGPEGALQVWLAALPEAAASPQ